VSSASNATPKITIFFATFDMAYPLPVHLDESIKQFFVKPGRMTDEK
jgi:hypothetical protein